MNNENDILRPSQAQAARMARRLGCSGAHEFNGSWMPCSTHDELTRILDQINSLDEKDDECLPCSQGKSAVRLASKRRGRNPKRFEQLRERGVLGIDTLPDGSLVSGLQKSLTQWFKEQWVDISRPKKGGGFEPCGRDDADKGKYPKCVPAARARSMSAEEIRERQETPAYLRKGIQLSNPVRSSDTDVSRTQAKKDGLMGDNRFLHDNVD